jgi:hypothetical protein
MKFFCARQATLSQALVLMITRTKSGEVTGG